MTVSLQNLRQTLVTATLALLLIGAIAGLQLPYLTQLEQQSQTLSTTALEQQVEAERLRLRLLQNAPSFGFDNLIADWAFLSFLQYFGDDEARRRTGYSLSPEFFEIIVNHNPHFVEPYTFLSTSGSLFAGMPERSIALMAQGLSQLSPTLPPTSFYVWRQKAIDELLFLGDSQAARQSFETAAEWAEQSPYPNAQQVAEMSRRTATFLANNPDSKTAQISAWMMVFNTAPDERTQETALQRIEALGGQVLRGEDGSLQITAPAED